MVTLDTLIAVPLWALQAAAPAITKPPLVQGLPDRFAEADIAFRARVADIFPPGFPEADLIRRLSAEGFAQHSTGASDTPETRWAFVRLPMSACVVTWRVRWQARDGHLVTATGDQGATCL
ncbi:hypothetical protein ACLBWX_08155 [Methylobacterium sp. M6A4_1b]